MSFNYTTVSSRYNTFHLFLPKKSIVAILRPFIYDFKFLAEIFLKVGCIMEK